MSVDGKSLTVATDLCEKLRTGLGDNLGSFVLYGSAVRGDMVSGRSDINVLIVLNHSTPEAHRAIAEQLLKVPSVSPFVLSRWELPRSLRVFAIKFRSIGRNYKVLYGEDFLADFAPPQSLLPFLCEQSLRNLRLRLKQGYIRNLDKSDRYAQILVRNYSPLITALSELLRCEGTEVPADRTDRTAILERQWGIDAGVLDDLADLRNHSNRLSADQAFDFHSRLFCLLSAALDRIRQQWPQAIEM